METRIIEVDPRELKLLDVNARFMRHEEFMQLVANIKKDGKLTSVPFACLEDDGKYLVLSGNHRVKASISAGLEKIPVMVTDDKLSKSQKIGIQLSHNSINGEDDPYILKELYASIADIDWKEYSGLNDKTLELLEKVNAQSLSEANLDFQTLAVTFLPDELEDAQKIIDKAIKASYFADATWLSTSKEYDRWLDAQEKVAESYKVKNVATALDIVLKVFESHINDLSDAWEDNLRDSDWVSIDLVIGRSKIPVKTAKALKSAVDTMMSRKEINKNEIWKSLEIMAQAYLNKGNE